LIVLLSLLALSLLGWLLLATTRFGLTARRNSAGDLHDVVVLIVKEGLSVLVETGVGVVIEVLGFRAVNVVPPIANQSDLVEHGHVRTQVRSVVSVDITTMEDLAFAGVNIGVETRVLELCAVECVSGELGDEREVFTRLDVQVEFLDLVNAQLLVGSSSEDVESREDFRALISALDQDTSAASSDEEKEGTYELHDSELNEMETETVD